MNSNAETKLSLEPGKWASQVQGEIIGFAQISYDNFADNPMDDDGNGKILSFSNRHSNFIGNDQEVEIKRLLKSPNTVKLSYFEHSLCKWFVSPDEGGEVTPGIEFRWDGVRFAGLWVPDECAIDNMRYQGKREKKKRHEVAIEYAKGVCEVYTSYCNGDVYVIETKTFNVLRDDEGNVLTDYDDYEDEEAQVNESQGNTFGWDYAEKECLSQLEYALSVPSVSQSPLGV